VSVLEALDELGVGGLTVCKVVVAKEDEALTSRQERLDG
jgi:hypothetical protein